VAVLNDKARDLIGLSSEDREANTVTVRLFSMFGMMTSLKFLRL